MNIVSNSILFKGYSNNSIKVSNFDNAKKNESVIPNDNRVFQDARGQAVLDSMRAIAGASQVQNLVYLTEGNSFLENAAPIVSKDLTDDHRCVFFPVGTKICSYDTFKYGQEPLTVFPGQVVVVGEDNKLELQDVSEVLKENLPLTEMSEEIFIKMLDFEARRDAIYAECGNDTRKADRLVKEEWNVFAASCQ